MSDSAQRPDSDNTPGKQLELIQSILFTQERERIRALEERAMEFRQSAVERLEALQAESQALSKELETARQLLGGEIESLRQIQGDLDGLVERLTPTIGEMIGDSIRNSPDVMAEALGPVMGDAIRVQIRNSRQEMIDVLYPIIGETIQKSINEFTRELQRNIDARFKTTNIFSTVAQDVSARLRGVPSSRLALRDALPFAIKEIFLVHRESGMLIAHSHPETAETSDADLVSNMLTAIRDFVRDAYGRGQEASELDEIQYGGQRIILVSGAAAYLAVVITGTESEGFRATLREFVASLHVRYARELRAYNGDPASVPNISPQLREMSQKQDDATPVARPLTGQQKWIMVGIVIGMVMCIVLSCFYFQFTVALLPVAFPRPSQTLTSTPSATANPTATSTVTLTVTPTVTSTVTPTITVTATLQAFQTTTGNVWVRSDPQDVVQPFTTIAQGTLVRLLETRDVWGLIAWKTAEGEQRGWVPLIWLSSTPVLATATP